MIRAAIYIEDYHTPLRNLPADVAIKLRRVRESIPDSLEEGPHGLPADIAAGVRRTREWDYVPLDVQERACRAYCERMGYQVTWVYRNTTLPPDHAKAKDYEAWRLDRSKGEWEWLFLYRSRHPYYVVRNRLVEGEIDVIVEFFSQGPSRSCSSLFKEGLELPLPLSHLEYATRWEIEPPTERQRQIYGLVERIRRAESEWEIMAAHTQIEALLEEERELAARPRTALEWLDRQVQEQGVSASDVMREALEEYARQHGFVPSDRVGSEE